MPARTTSRDHALFQVWVTKCDAWRPKNWYDIPREAQAIEPADRRCLAAEDARQFVEGFNRCMLRERSPFWAIAVPVMVRIQGEPQAGDRLNPGGFDEELGERTRPAKRAG